MCIKTHVRPLFITLPEGGAAMPDINSDIQYLKGVGPAYAKKFAKLGIYTNPGSAAALSAAVY